MSEPETTPALSVVIPTRDRRQRLAETLDALATRAVEGGFEVIVVDDASSDGTGREETALLKDHAKLRYLRHDTRSGQSAALRTGAAAAIQPVIATMDGDGQNDPGDIEKLFVLIGEPDGPGPALAGGVREKRKATGSRRFASRFANWVRDTVLRDECPDSGCGFKVFHRDAFLRLPFFTSMHRYLPALMQSYGLETAYASVNDRPRLAGKSKYTNLGRALVGLYDMMGVVWLRRRTAVPGIAEDSAKPRQKSGG